MDWDELLTLITLGAVSPYVFAAAARWLKNPCREHDSGANAPG